MTQRKRCFVISPIGAEKSEIRQHADDVFDYIIKPAMDECQIEAVRSDHLREPGKISDHMFREILTDDLCIAVLTEFNPNVFYELAIAQAAARPVIIMMEKGQTLPFDIHDLRCVYYDLKPRPLFERVYISEIVEHVRGLERSGWTGTTPWGDSLLSSTEGLGPHTAKFLSRSVDYGSPDVWLQLLRDTTDAFEILGISLGSWRRTKSFSEVLKEKAAVGCRIRVLIMHKDNPSLRHLINDEIPEARFNSVVNEIEENVGYFSEIAAQEPNVEIRQILKGSPHCQITRTDQWAVFVLYLYSERSHFSPLWQFAQGSPPYGLMQQEFESFWRANPPQGT